MVALKIKEERLVCTDLELCSSVGVGIGRQEGRQVERERERERRGGVG